LQVSDGKVDRYAKIVEGLSGGGEKSKGKKRFGGVRGFIRWTVKKFFSAFWLGVQNLGGRDSGTHSQGQRRGLRAKQEISGPNSVGPMTGALLAGKDWKQMGVAPYLGGLTRELKKGQGSEKKRGGAL